MAESDERTRLLANEDRQQYVFNSSLARERKKKFKQFQCLLCGAFLCFVIVALIMSVIFSITANFDDEPNANSSMTNDTAPAEIFSVFLTRTWPLDETKTGNVTSQNSTLWKASMLFGQESLIRREELEKILPQLPVDSPSYRHQTVTSTSKRAIELSRIGYMQECGTKYMHRDEKNKSVKWICPNITSEPMEQFCEIGKLPCNRYKKYRSFDGTCNNLKHSDTFGTAFRQFRRVLPPDYADGISKPRVSKSGTPLPSARTVSMIVHRPYYRDDNKFSVMLAVWGQFLDHDITATALSKRTDGKSISCCIVSDVIHPECFPVIIDEKDPLRSENNVSCMEFVRSAPSPACCLGPREQMNQVTAFIDGSVVYGVEKPLVEELRTLKGGQLKMFVTSDNRTLLPVSTDPNDGCNRIEAKEKGEYCFEAGDGRSNENLHLTSMHTIWARHHNSIADNLSRINSKWDDEQLFQETRRIIGAEMQHITYKEFLPIILGPKLMEELDLSPKKEGYFYKYNESIDASIANHFASAAFRFAHTIIPGLMKLLASDKSSPEFIKMHEMLFNPFKLYEPGEMDKALRGAINTDIEANDAYFTNELKQHLFERNDENSTKPKKYGLDLVSLNLQRGRDHGLPGYVEWRQHCGFNKTSNFEDLSDYMDADSLKNIKSLYRDVADVDLYTGALSEKPLEGSILGPTLTCLILDQFVRLKYGDRFWYENRDEYTGFSPQQLNEIRKVSLAKIICENSDNVTHIQPLVMERTREGNDIVPCVDLPGVDLKYWKDEMDRIPIGDSTLEVRTPKPT